MARFVLRIAALLLLGWPAFAEPDRNAIVRLHELVLPEFKQEKATLREGLEKVRQAWSAKYPEHSFPVIALESLERRSDSHLGATIDLKNVPALTVVTYLAQAHAMTVRYGLDVVVLRPVLAPDENAWESVMLLASKRVMKALELPTGVDGDESTHHDLKQRLEGYGIRFDSGFAVRWLGEQLFIRNTPEEISKVKGLFMLLDAGYTVQKNNDE